MSGSVLACRHSSFTKAAATVLCGLLALGSPSVAIGASKADMAQPAAALSVASDPAGATVYIDGESQGATPVEVKDLIPGDHRLRVVKPGYLENSRVLNVRGGGPQAVTVKLTPDVNAARSTATIQDPKEQEKKGGSGKKVALIGLGLAAAGAGAYLAFHKSNKPPVAGTVTLSPNEPALEGATNVSVSAQGASDPDGDALTYNWNFGDGATATGPSASHTYTNAGSYSVTVDVSDGKLSASSSGTATVRDLSATWGGTITGSFGVFPFTLSLSHSNTSVTGTWADPILGSGTIVGSVSSQKSVRLTVQLPGFAPATIAGNADADINRITGNITGSGFTGESVVLIRR